jgi:trk system potassium uptake protein
MNPRVVVRVNAVVILTLGVVLTVPLALSWLYGDGSWASFLFPSGAMILTGTAGLMLTQVSSGRALGYVSNKDVYLSVTLAWVLAAVLGGTPFLVEGTFVSPLDSTFEAMSGFTTTGATLLSDNRGRDAFDTLLAQHDPVAWRDRDRGPLRGGRSRDRVREEHPVAEGGLCHR